MNRPIIKIDCSFQYKNIFFAFKRAFIGCIIFLFVALKVSAQPNITQAEYFFDNEPGFGNGINVSIDVSTQLNNVLFSADISGLTIGVHQLFVRVKDANGSWSISNRTFFYKYPPALANAPNITKAEYFIDSDPGFGQGTTIAITPGTQILDQSFSSSIDALSVGVHQLFIRVLDGNGNWSISNRTFFYKYPAASANEPNIIGAEYFIDTDPGFGHATAISIAPGVQILNQNFLANTTGISSGTHKLFIRVLDANGNWSITNVISFNETFSPLSCNAAQVTGVTCYGGNNGSATVSATGGSGDYTYLWDDNETASTAIQLTAGLHSVLVTDANQDTSSCSVTIIQPISVLSCNTVQVSPASNGQNNGSATVTANGGVLGYSYLWDDAETTATATSLSAGLHTVTVTDGNGCTSSCSVTIDQSTDGSNPNAFVFLKGSATDFSIGSYGIQGIGSVGNNPGKRRFQTTWQYNGKLYVFGGEGNASDNGNPAPTGYLGDVWEFDPATNNWIWLKGNNTLGGSAVYGTKGLAASSNTPGARKNAMGWVVNNKFYLFGGYNSGRLCDLWEYDPATNNWTWIAGDNSTDFAGNYGSLGVSAATNLPAGREQGATWVYNGKLYLFGGIRSNGSNDVQMNDLWQFDFNTGWWTWINGSNLTNQFGNYGSQNVPASTNMPGSRYESGFSMIGDMTYIYGGTGYGASSGGILSDLWQYDNTTGNWTWLKGSTTNDELKVIGTQGAYDADNTPGARTGSNITAQSNTLYLYGGFNQFFGGSFQSDLWQFDPYQNQWRWLKGATGVGTIGDFGFQNVESNSNLPGGRGQATLAAIGSNLYLFAGRGYSGISTASDESQNDLWKLNTANNNWTWLKGYSGKQYYGEYGTKGVSDSTNRPGGRVAASSIGANGKYYLFGGQANTTYPNFGTTNDLWQYDPGTGNWTWLKGSDVNGSSGNYGTIGVSSPMNEPPFRTNAMMWNIGNKIYMFGGTIGANFNDLWEYDISTNNWTWLKGSNSQNQSGVYGTMGVAASSNTPGARWLASTFTYNNKLYLFGGNGYNSGGTTGELNDLWEYDPATNNWTWIGGNDAINSFGVYGTINVASPSNIPGARESGQIQTIGDTAYLFGGRGYASSGGFQNLNDTWKYDFATNQWKWVKGLSTGGNGGVAGSYGIEDPANYPIARYSATSWTLGNKFYVFSGTPFGAEYNDLWEYNPATNNWRYIKGNGNVGNTPANYGLQGIANQNNLPSIRWSSTAAIAGGSAYIFGGFGGFANSLWPNSGSYMNDLWKWVPGPVFFYGNERKIYVNDNNLTGDTYTTAVGNNQNPGTPSAPLATLDFAVSVAQPGDTIYVDAGTYATANFSVNKALTIIGTNPNVAVNDPSNRLLYNTARNPEAIISGSTITIGSSNIRFQGFTFDPGAKSQFLQTNSALDFNNIEISANRFFISSNQALINLTGRNITPLSSNFYFILNNRFEKTAGTGNNAILLNFINIAHISGNVFTISNPSLARTQFAINIGSSGKVDNLTIAGNIFDRYSGTVTTSKFGTTLIDDNTVYDCQSGFNLGNNITEPATLSVTRNVFNNIRTSFAVSNSRTNATDNTNLNVFTCENNTININVTGQTTNPSSMISSSVGNTVVNSKVIIRNNIVNYAGDFSSVTTPATPSAIRLLGRDSLITIENNEFNFAATNLPSTIIPNIAGIFIFSKGTTTGNLNAIPSNAVITMINNKISGFKQSLEFFDITTNSNGGLLSGVSANINNNSFTNDSISINNGTTSQTVNANCNWYGIARADSVVQKVTISTVNFTPWLTNGTDTDIPTPGFQPIANVCNGTPVVVSLNQANNLTCFESGNGSIDVNVNGGVLPYSFQWNKQNDPSFINSGTEDLSGLQQGTYKLIVTDAVGSKDSITIVITQPDLLTANGSGTNVSCYEGNNGTAFVAVSGGTQSYSYLWSNNATTQSISGLIAGNYSVMVTDANGCTAQSNYQVTQPTQLTVVMSGTSASCSGNATATPVGGTTPYSYQWSNGETTQTINGVPHGTYIVIVTDAHGCTVIDSFTVKGNSPINPTAQVVNVSCYGGSNGSITITGASGTPPYTYSINGSPYQSSNVFAGLSAGTYTISVTDATGCVDFVTKTITQPAAMSIVLDSMRTACYGSNNGRIYVTASGGSGAKTYSWTGPNGYTSTAQDPNNIVAGNYSVTVTDSKGCAESLSVVLLQWPAVTVSNITTNVSCRGGSTGAIDLTVSGGTGSGFTYSWTGPNSFITTTEDINGLAAGNYKITVTDLGSGCSVQQTITVSQPSSNLTISTSKTNATGCNSLGSITATGVGGTSPYQYSFDGTYYQSSGSFTALYAGTYTIWIKDANGCINSKSVSITDNGSDEFEGNNTKGQAKQIPIGTTISARIAVSTDVADWFKFTTGSAGGYILTLTHPSASFVFNLYPAGNNTAALTPVSSTAQSKIFNLAANTTYYIDITGGLSYVCYQLSISTFIATRPNNNNTTVLENVPFEVLKATAYPNPHLGQFNLRIESPVDGIVTVELFNLNGEKVIEKKVGVQKNVASIVNFTDHKDAVLFYKAVIGKYSAVGKVLGPN